MYCMAAGTWPTRNSPTWPPRPTRSLFRRGRLGGKPGHMPESRLLPWDSVPCPSPLSESLVRVPCPSPLSESTAQGLVRVPCPSPLSESPVLVPFSRSSRSRVLSGGSSRSRPTRRNSPGQSFWPSTADQKRRSESLGSGCDWDPPRRPTRTLASFTPSRREWPWRAPSARLPARGTRQGGSDSDCELAAARNLKAAAGLRVHG